MAKLEYTFVSQLQPQEYEDLMDRGYRKFGMACFRPVCEHCRKCRPIRVAVERFHPDRSQRRAWRDSRQLQVKLGDPQADEQRVALYNRYHLAQAFRKGWPAHETDAEEYAFTYLQPVGTDSQFQSRGEPVGTDSQFPNSRKLVSVPTFGAPVSVPAVEISVWEGGVLRAVVLTDVTPNAISAVYHYYEPKPVGTDSQSRLGSGLVSVPTGLGTFCVLQAIELARRLKRPWVYLGYYVAGCASMAYKARFLPNEIMDEGGLWNFRF